MTLDSNEMAPTNDGRIAPVVEGRRRAWPVLLLALPAFVAIWSGWVELGRLTGFGEVQPLPGIWDALTIDTAITLPVGVETYAAYALNVWLAGGTSTRATRFARASALGSLALGAAGQVAYHLMSAAGMVSAPWQITAVVACLPVAVLGMGAALYHLVNEHQAEDVPALDAAEAWTERSVIANAVRERHPDPIAETAAETADVLAEPGHGEEPETDDAAVAVGELSREEDSLSRLIDLVNVMNARHPEWNLPVPEARTEGRPGASTRKPRRVDAGTKIRDLRAKHPDWTVEKIAAKAGVTDRTVRRHLNAPTAIAPTAIAPVEADQTPDLAA
ncbi:hypothetical protein JCM9957A_46310 [Kineosporia succinea]|uniref:AraC-like DNA-binding protein n=1 Tax=Kineosporia succinea TaxID=84632 RepID=A0ABT9P458_9ACTN|nr:hypothetical protein [Kineosporia succinea]MDP9827481.1 AraC-like DNA-binding protein [Kineosporia succinea]